MQALILIKLFPTSLLLVSTYGLLDNLVRLLLGAFVGQLIDTHDRLRGAQLCYTLQTLCIGSSAAAAAVLVSLDRRQSDGSLRDTSPRLFWLLAGAAMFLGASSSIGSLGAAVAVEREHTKVLCGDDSTALRKLNSGQRSCIMRCVRPWVNVWKLCTPWLCAYEDALLLCWPVVAACRPCCVLSHEGHRPAQPAAGTCLLRVHHERGQPAGSDRAAGVLQPGSVAAAVPAAAGRPQTVAPVAVRVGSREVGWEMTRRRQAS